MAFVFKPSVWQTGDGATVTELPRPITSLRIPTTWDFRKAKVPLKDGTVSHGWSHNGMSITVQGILSKQGSTLKTDDENMWTLYESIRSKIDIDAATDKFEFFVYHDASSATYRKFKDCVAQAFEIDVGDQARVVFSYSLEIFVEDPVIYTTAPGS